MLGRAKLPLETLRYRCLEKKTEEIAPVYRIGFVAPGYGARYSHEKD
jgi:hypothetical protein